MAAAVNRDGSLAGKVAVVTGASRGIGEAVAIRYAMEGAKVVVSARTMEEGEHILPGSMKGVVDRITRAGGAAAAIRCDLSLREDRERLIAETEATFGPVDILVNNGAVTFFQPTEGFSEKRLKLMFEVQVFAPLHLSQLVIPGMRAKGRGSILNISSHAAIHPPLTQAGGGTVYGMCKASLERFTTGLAAELNRDNITVNVISPGLIATPGVIHHGLINETTKDRAIPVEHMAEACLRLVQFGPDAISGRIAYATEFNEEFGLQPAQLV